MQAKRKTAVKEEIVDKIWELNNKWMKQEDIAKELGLSQQTVSKKLKLN